MKWFNKKHSKEHESKDSLLESTSEPVRPYTGSRHPSLNRILFLAIVFISGASLVHTNHVQSSAQILTQTQWITGNATSLSTLPADDWNAYSTKDVDVKVKDDIRIVSSLYTMSQTSSDGQADICTVPDCDTGGGFNAGTMVDTHVKGIGTEGFVELASTPSFKDWTLALAGKYDTDGTAYDIAVDGKYAYVADGKKGLAIIDISNPKSPVLTGTYKAKGSFQSVVVHGDYAYIAAGSAGLIVVNVSNKSSPSTASIYDSGGTAENVFVAGNTAYLADGKKGLRIVDVTNKAKISPINTYDTAGSAHDVLVVGDYAFIADDSAGLVVVEIDSPLEPELAATLNTGTALGLGISTTGNHLFITDSVSHLNIIDITSPSAPKLVTTHKAASDGGAVSVGNYTYLVDGESGLRVFDMTAPAKPKLVGTYNTNGIAINVDVHGNYAYVVNGSSGLEIVDIKRPPLAPVLKATFDTSGIANAVAALGNYAYVADTRKGLKIIDLSSPSSPTLAGEFNTSGEAEDVAVAGNYAYVADGNSGLQIINTTDKANPSLAGSLNTSGHAYGIDVRGNYAFIADGSSGLQIIDVSVPSVPMLEIMIGTSGKAIDVVVSGSYAYVADGTAGLHIIDISSVETPSLVGTYDTNGSANGVAIVKNVAYVADDTDGLLIIDVTKPSDPFLILTFPTVGSAQGVEAIGKYAYVAQGAAGIQVINITDPTTPTLTASLDTTGLAVSVASVGWNLYVADQNDGIHIIDASSAQFAKPTLTGTYPLSTAEDVAVIGNTAYVVDGKSLSIIDVTIPTSPTMIGSHGFTSDAIGVAVADDTAYVTDKVGLNIIDVSDPSSPSLMGSYKTSGNAQDVAVIGNKAYVADESGGLKIIDVTHPSSPRIAGVFNVAGSSNGVTVDGNYAYVADNTGLQIIDISTSSVPVLTGMYNTFRNTNNVAVDGDYAYVADNAGVLIIDISKPSSPTLAAIFTTAGNVNDIVINGNYAYLTDFLVGVTAINISNPRAPVEVAKYDTNGGVFGIALAGNYAFMAKSASGLQIIKVTDYLKTGTFVSPVIDLGTDQDFNAFAWEPSGQAENTTLKMEAQAGLTDKPDCPGSCSTWTNWKVLTNDRNTGSTLDGNRYYRYRATLDTTDTATSPQLNELTLSFPTFSPASGIESSVFDIGDAGGFLTNIAWTEKLDTHDVRLQVATSPDNINWNYCGAVNCSAGGWLDILETDDNFYTENTGELPNIASRDANGDRYFKYKFWLVSSDGLGTPKVEDIDITYDIAHLEVLASDGKSTSYKPQAGAAFNIAIIVKNSDNAVTSYHDGSRTLKLTASISQKDAENCVSSFNGAENTEFDTAVTFSSGVAMVSNVMLCTVSESSFTISAKETSGGYLTSTSQLTISGIDASPTASEEVEEVVIEPEAPSKEDIIAEINAKLKESGSIDPGERKLYDVVIKLGDNVHDDPVEDARGSYKHGDVVTVKPSGHQWSDTEKSMFLIVEMYLTQREVASLLRPEKLIEGIETKRRKKKIKMEELGHSTKDHEDVNKRKALQRRTQGQRLNADEVIEAK